MFVTREEVDNVKNGLATNKKRETGAHGICIQYVFNVFYTHTPFHFTRRTCCLKTSSPLPSPRSARRRGWGPTRRKRDCVPHLGVRRPWVAMRLPQGGREPFMYDNAVWVCVLPGKKATQCETNAGVEYQISNTKHRCVYEKKHGVPGGHATVLVSRQRTCKFLNQVDGKKNKLSGSVHFLVPSSFLCVFINVCASFRNRSTLMGHAKPISGGGL